VRQRVRVTFTAGRLGMAHTTYTVDREHEGETKEEIHQLILAGLKDGEKDYEKRFDHKLNVKITNMTWLDD